MKITFIRPNIFDGRLDSAMEVLAFAILKALTPPDVETELYDERLEEIPYDLQTDLVAITVETFTARRAYQIAENFRRRGIPVVMGGFHPTMLPGEASLFADAVVVGDAEGVWSEIVADARLGRLKPIYKSDGFLPIDDVRLDRSIFDGKSYAPIKLIQWSRGCRFNCSFCAIRGFYGSSLRKRPVQKIVEEIKEIRPRLVLFVDDNIFYDTESAKELMRALIPLKILWCCQVSIDVTRDPELLDLMQRSGCMLAIVGLETIDRSNLRQMRKEWNVKWVEYETAIKRFQDHGIMMYGTFVLGWDHDNPEVFDKTVEFAIRHKFTLSGFNPLMPTPGTKTYNDLRENGQLLYEKWWVDPDYKYGQAVFKPAQMTVEEFTEGCFRARKKFSSLGSILTRATEPKSVLSSPFRMLSFAVSNRILYKEIYAKQFSQFGAVEDFDPYDRIMAAERSNMALHAQ